ncbi:MAG: ABC-2 transporter permease [Saprospiraceae bacterium]
MIPLPFGGQNRAKLKKSEYTLGILGALAVLLVAFLYAFEVKYFSNTFEVEGLVWRSLFVGVLVGITAGYFFSKQFNDGLEKLKLYVFFIVISLLLFPLLGSLSNRVLSFSPKQKIEVELQSQEAYLQSRFGRVKTKKKKDGIFLFFVKDQKIQRVKTKETLFPNSKKGDRVYIVTKKGFWGYEYFIEE